MSIAEYTLAHHGVKGQKWYQRRYQNSDGTLTAAGRKRYAKDAARAERKQQKAENKKQKALKIEAKKAQKAEKVLKQRMQEIADKKKKIFESNNVEEMRKNSNLFSEKEVNDFVNKVKLDNRLKALNEENQKSLVDKAISAVDKVSKAADTGVKVFDSYTNIAKRVNRIMGDTVLPDFDAEAAKKAAKLARQETLRKIPYDKVLANASKYSDEDIKYISDRINNMNTLHNNIDTANNNKLKKIKEQNKNKREQELRNVSYDEILQNPNKFSDDDLVYLNNRFKNMSGMLTNVSNVQSKQRTPSEPNDSLTRMAELSNEQLLEAAAGSMREANRMLSNSANRTVTMDSIDEPYLQEIEDRLEDLRSRRV